MPAYNSELYISDSINSVISQTYTNWELIIIDDGSTDCTVEIVLTYVKRDSRIKYYYQENKKLPSARNLGIQLSNGEYISFLDSDDIWMPEKLVKQIKKFTENTSIDLIYTNGQFINENGDHLAEYPSIFGLFSGKEMYKLLFFNNYIPVLSVLLKKKLIDRIGKMDVSLIFGCEDWDYWLRAASLNHVFFGLEDKLFKYRIHPGGMSRKFYLMKYAEFIVLNKNSEFNLIPINKVVKRLSVLVEECISELLKKGYRSLVINMINIKIKLRFSISYLIVLLVVKLNLSSFFFLIPYILKPKLIFIRINKIFIYMFTLYNKFNNWVELKIVELKKIFFKLKYHDQFTFHQSLLFHKNLTLKIEYPFSILRIDKNVCFRNYCQISIFGNGKLLIGSGVFFNNFCSINCLGEINIGENTIFGESVKMYDHNHKYYSSFKSLEIKRNEFNIGKIKIGNNCWIGSNVTILNNVEIGDNVIIGANCLIFKSIPSNTIVKKSEVLNCDYL